MLPISTARRRVWLVMMNEDEHACKREWMLADTIS